MNPLEIGAGILAGATPKAHPKTLPDYSRNSSRQLIIEQNLGEILVGITRRFSRRHSKDSPVLIVRRIFVK